MDTDDTVVGLLDVIDIETAVADFTFRIEGDHGDLFTVDQSAPDAPRLKLKDGAERIDTGQSYHIVVVAIDADGGESRIELTILQGGFYIETADGDRVYNNGDALINEAFDAQAGAQAGVTEDITGEIHEAAIPATARLGDQLVVTTNTNELAADANGWQVELRLDTGLDGGGTPTVETSFTVGGIILVEFGTGATLDQIIAAVEAATGGVGGDIGDLVTVSLQEGASGEDTAVAVGPVALSGAVDAILLRGIDLGAIGIEGGLDAALDGDALRAFFLTDNAINVDFRIIDVSGAPHLYYVGRDSGDFEAGASLQVELGIRYITGEVDSSGDTADADIRSFTLTGAEITIAGAEQNMVSIAPGTLTADNGGLITIAAEDFGPQVPDGGRFAVVVFPDDDDQDTNVRFRSSWWLISQP